MTSILKQQFDLGEMDAEWAPTTHVLIWIPGHFAKGGGPGGWEFQPRGAYEAGCFLDNQNSPDLPEDAEDVDLAGWVAANLGHPVRLLPAEESIRRAFLGIGFGREYPVPIWLVVPA